LTAFESTFKFCQY